MKQELFLIAIALCTAAAFAQDAKSVNTAGDWYVCLGSFKSAANARQFSSILKEQGLPNTVTVRVAAGSNLYRVFYDQPFERRDDARIFCSGLLSDNKIHQLKLSGLWICEATPTLLGEVLQKNDGAMLLISEEKPCSLKVYSYKEERPAQQNSERLHANICMVIKDEIGRCNIIILLIVCLTAFVMYRAVIFIVKSVTRLKQKKLDILKEEALLSLSKGSSQYEADIYKAFSNSVSEV